MLDILMLVLGIPILIAAGAYRGARWLWKKARKQQPEILLGRSANVVELQPVTARGDDHGTVDRYQG